MNTNETTTPYVEDEIDLKELILAIWKRKIMIISITIIIALLAGVYTIFWVTPVYNTKLNVIVSMPEKYSTRYGEYKLPLTTNDQYIQLFTSNDVLVRTIKDLGIEDKANVDILRSKISVKNIFNNAQNGNVFEITVSSNQPEDSLKLAETLYKNYMDFLDIMIKKQVVNYFYNSFTIELITLEIELTQEQQSLKSNEELLSQIEMELTSNNSGIGVMEPLGENGNYVVPINTINPNYINVETDILKNKQRINDLTNKMDRNKKYLVELEEGKESIQMFYDTGKTNALSLDLIGIVETSVQMPSSPVAPSSKASPSTTLNIAIGTVLGGMIGIMVALFQWYWYKES